jgi:hypothetical protein
MLKKAATDIELLVNDGTDYFQVCINEFASQASTHFQIPCKRINAKSDLFFKVIRVLSRYLYIPPIGGRRVNKKTSLSITIGPDFSPVFNGGRKTGKAMYFFDCWPQNNKWVIEFSRIFGIDHIFFSAKQAADAFNEVKGNRSRTKGTWIPEGIKVDNYKSYPYEEKNIDVLEFGRRYEQYHLRIRETLQKAGYSHAFAQKGQLLFPDEPAFVEGLAKSKISICFPSSITHPERSGNVSTMTLRYLQSMAAKCLIVGKMPYDMQYLFDYAPVVEIDENDPGAQIVDILKHYDQYIPLIEKNYETVVRQHDWKNRLEAITKELCSG